MDLIPNDQSREIDSTSETIAKTLDAVNSTTTINGIGIFEAAVAEQLFSIIKVGFATMEGQFKNVEERLDGFETRCCDIERRFEEKIASVESSVQNMDKRIDGIHELIESLNLENEVKLIRTQAATISSELELDRKARKKHAGDMARAAHGVEENARERVCNDLKRRLENIEDATNTNLQYHKKTLDTWRLENLENCPETRTNLQTHNDDFVLPLRIAREESLSRIVTQLAVDAGVYRTQVHYLISELSAESLSLPTESMQSSVNSLSSLSLAAVAELEAHKAATAALKAREAQQQRQQRMGLENIVEHHKNSTLEAVEFKIEERFRAMKSDMSEQHNETQSTLEDLIKRLRSDLARQAIISDNRSKNVEQKAEMHAATLKSSIIESKNELQEQLDTDFRPAIGELYSSLETFATKHDVAGATRLTSSFRGDIDSIQDRIKVLNIINERHQKDVDRITNHQSIIVAELEEKVAAVLMNYMVSAQSAVTLLPLAGTEMVPFQSAAQSYRKAVLKAEEDKQRREAGPAKSPSTPKKLSTLERIILRGERLDGSGIIMSGDTGVDPRSFSNSHTETLMPGHASRNHSPPLTTWKASPLPKTQTVPARVPYPADGRSKLNKKSNMVFTKHAKKNSRPQSAGAVRTSSNGNPLSRHRTPGPFVVNAVF